MSSEKTNWCNLKGAWDGSWPFPEKEQSFFKTLEILYNANAEGAVHSFFSFDSFYMTFTYYLWLCLRKPSGKGSGKLPVPLLYVEYLVFASPFIQPLAHAYIPQIPCLWGQNEADCRLKSWSYLYWYLTGPHLLWQQLPGSVESDSTSEALVHFQQ